MAQAAAWQQRMHSLARAQLLSMYFTEGGGQAFQLLWLSMKSGVRCDSEMLRRMQQDQDGAGSCWQQRYEAATAFRGAAVLDVRWRGRGPPARRLSARPPHCARYHLHRRN